MRYTLLFFAIGYVSIINAQQSITDFRANKKEIKGELGVNGFEADIEQSKEISSILTQDVYRYYDLAYQYDSDLKRKVFEGSEEFKQKESELINIKAQLLSELYFLDFEPSYYERNNLIKYNIQTRTFSVSNSAHLGNYYNKIGFVQFDEYILKLPTGISIKKRTYNAGGVDFVEQEIVFKIADEVTALKIEEESDYLKVLFIFKFSGTVTYQGKDIFGYSEMIVAPISNLAQVILYNSETNNIYHIFK